MHFRSTSVQFRLSRPCREEFSKELYRPGVVSLTRIIWGSLGGGLLLWFIAILSGKTGINVLYPPLAATCFINTTCVFLRVARPKSVIVGHTVASICGLAGVWIGNYIAPGPEFIIPVKLGLSVMLAAVFMQIFDADHPPAAATAAIPAILPLPMPWYLLPLHMAWGATITVIFAFIWNRIWFEFPVRDSDNCVKNAGLYMEKVQIAGLAICIVSCMIMCFQSISPTIRMSGLWGMAVGNIILGTHHFYNITSS
ncbi:HPP family protein [Maridesulfovibrio sp.]|uniref:HPP family protein n=1 Tax=Maridesulfovibrio sp. TaxID=2795000 RepID=UPI0029CA0902|nr:HPP family protein [Maridesulfovibrio sp.]